MTLPTLKLDALESIPVRQKAAALVIVLLAIGAGFHFYVAQPRLEVIEELERQVSKLDAEIQANTAKVKHLDELIAANQQLELELARKKERLPPADEAVMMLKQLSDLAIRLGLDIKLWKPGTQVEDPSKLFLRLPVSVEVAGSYHTAALFFDRIRNLPRIMNVSDLKMGATKTEKDRVVIQTFFELTAFVAPPEGKPAAPAVPATAGSPLRSGA
jgi:type IV pilus assembly protein PilO